MSYRTDSFVSCSDPSSRLVLTSFRFVPKVVCGNAHLACFRVAGIQVMDTSESDTEVASDHCSVCDTPRFSTSSHESCSMLVTPEFATASPGSCPVFVTPEFATASPGSCPVFDTPEFATASPESCPLFDTPVLATSSPGSCSMYDASELPTTPSKETDATVGTSRRYRMEALRTSSSNASLCESRSPSLATTILFEDEFLPVELPFIQDVPDLDG